MSQDEVKKVVEEVFPMNNDEYSINRTLEVRRILTQAIPSRLWMARSEIEIFEKLLTLEIHTVDCILREVCTCHAREASERKAKALVKFMRGDV